MKYVQFRFFVLAVAMTGVGCSSSSSDGGQNDGGALDAGVIPCACANSDTFAIWETPTTCACYAYPNECVDQVGCTCFETYAGTTVRSYCANWNNTSYSCSVVGNAPVFRCIP
jgi:hypothetical protein